MLMPCAFEEKWKTENGKWRSKKEIPSVLCYAILLWDETEKRNVHSRGIWLQDRIVDLYINHSHIHTVNPSISQSVS